MGRYRVPSTFEVWEWWVWGCGPACTLTEISCGTGHGLDVCSDKGGGWCREAMNASLSRLCSCVPRNGEDRMCPKCRGDDSQSVSPGSLLSQEKVRGTAWKEYLSFFFPFVEVEAVGQLPTKSLEDTCLLVWSLDCISL